MIGISLIKILFLYRAPIYQSCFDPLGSDCLNNGWSISNRIDTCAGIKYIGRFGERVPLTQTFLCPQGLQMKFSFTIGMFDSWDLQENFFVYCDNVLIDTFKYTPAHSSHLCFDSVYREDIVQKSFRFQSPLGKNSLTLKLQDDLDESINNESWGIRNVLLEVFEPCVDFFSECNYQGEFWRICAGNQTSLSKNLPLQIKSIIILKGIIVKLKDAKYFGGNMQTYTTDQPCLNDFNFPKYQKTI
ncbi:unnamed protein product [Paramecium sonneborni]|uniref:Uncharacterized protein n=1 Tax=Paramecium sonneborni TaxID=65129 RepID=A0A8S1QRK4_9CILI|nr:unnamed protein product [Paramecium sonneborni]